MKYNFSQYTTDLHRKISFDFLPGKRLLDVGCGTCVDSYFFKNIHNLDVYSTDVFKHKNVDTFGLKFKVGSIINLPYKSSCFDYVFVHDVLHHIDEKHQKYSMHVNALRELKRVVKNNGVIVIVEANRYNPLFYPHMVRLLKHNHFTQKYFKSLIKSVFEIESVSFKYFECHAYPKRLYKFFKVYELLMEKFVPERLLAYNCAIIQVKK
ncbi:class I SAM-dependent methyltransferase [candidate division WWE3 bacterium]|uniref:Class I SAM-dependent methyltransferase n=1 Tax=candidate division WWE3 bacterium TaxID=2053526 RepID=A0A7X9E6L1_UNCKA|nr:class I SAM-dependent methyltransferase [candidate division WWE3 bacterium]